MMEPSTLGLCVLVAVGAVICFLYWRRSSSALRASAASRSSGSIGARPGGRTIDRPRYSLTYPGDWTIDEKDEDFDLDYCISIDLPDGGGHLTLFFYDQWVDASNYLEEHTKTMNERVFKVPATERSFSKWGSLRGLGVELRGSTKPVGKARLRAFVYAEAQRAVVVDEYCFDEDLPRAEPGFNVIADSFRLK